MHFQYSSESHTLLVQEIAENEDVMMMIKEI